MSRSPFLEMVRQEIRLRGYSMRTERTYLYWIRHFVLFNDKLHPEALENAEIERFQRYLVVNRKVSAGTRSPVDSLF
ncbi:site-specific integrase [Gilvimarinus sp. SDUM040013]|uniref:Site-specific integrase n=1 Tax=Gilvimarinus gilvus TaxID=3058038 RepID=A0ABU4S333_9GAMM|nr:site-specific integrase [Gilvimarinus sp. SDUM040013]MDO3384934.1 site-specific integrase [Gilvimarinus sp. SDUM040013]MDX6851533.1 site-specific integrase [Gilvimarinus sp. SDUM040013]